MADVEEEIEREVRPIEVLKAQISEEHQAFAKEMINEACSASSKIEKDIATKMKKGFDEKFGGTWHCVVGASYGCSVTHETKYLFFFKFDGHHVLIFQSAD